MYGFRGLKPTATETYAKEHKSLQINNLQIWQTSIILVLASFLYYRKTKIFNGLISLAYVSAPAGFKLRNQLNIEKQIEEMRLSLHTV